MRIVDFLLNNLYLVIILLGFLVSLLGKSTRKPEQGQTPGGDTAPAPRRAPKTTSGPVRRPPIAHQPSQPAKMPRQAQEDSSQAMSEDEWLRRQKHQASRERREEEERSQAIERQVKLVQPERVNLPARPVNIQANKAVEGMMWAEVFGPPRARRGHNSRYLGPRGRR